MTDVIPEVPLEAAPPALVEEDASAVQPSILTDLRARRSELGSGSKPLELDVPGYGGQLVLQFRWVTFKQLARTGTQLARIKEPTAQTIAAAADAIVATCSEILCRVEENGARVVLPLSTNGIPVTFADPRVAYTLGFDPTQDARTTVIRAFNNEYALIDVANRVTTWLEDTSKAVDEEYVGN